MALHKMLADRLLESRLDPMGCRKMRVELGVTAVTMVSSAEARDSVPGGGLKEREHRVRTL